MTGTEKAGRAFVALIALLGGVAVIIQVAETIETVGALGRSPLDGIITAFSYFTVLTNTIVAMVAAACALRGEAGGFLTHPSTRAATAIYILVVGVIFALFLTGLRQMSGLTLVVDTTLHRIIPVLFPLYWLAFVPKGTLRWSDTLYWMIYPTLYVVYSLLYGAATGRYLYPFSDVGALGYAGALGNGLVILIGFFALGVAVVGLDRLMARDTS